MIINSLSPCKKLTVWNSILHVTPHTTLLSQQLLWITFNFPFSSDALAMHLLTPCWHCSVEFYRDNKQYEFFTWKCLCLDLHLLFYSPLHNVCRAHLSRSHRNSYETRVNQNWADQSAGHCWDIHIRSQKTQLHSLQKKTKFVAFSRHWAKKIFAYKPRHSEQIEKKQSKINNFEFIFNKFKLNLQLH